MNSERRVVRDPPAELQSWNMSLTHGLASLLTEATRLQTRATATAGPAQDLVNPLTTGILIVQVQINPHTNHTRHIRSTSTFKKMFYSCQPETVRDLTVAPLTNG